MGLFKVSNRAAQFPSFCGSSSSPSNVWPSLRTSSVRMVRALLRKVRACYTQKNCDNFILFFRCCSHIVVCSVFDLLLPHVQCQIVMSLLLLLASLRCSAQTEDGHGSFVGLASNQKSLLIRPPPGGQVLIDGAEFRALVEKVQALQELATATAERLLPAGAIMAFAMSSAPPGWLAADGSAKSRATFPALFSAIGTTHGAGDNITTFNFCPTCAASLFVAAGPKRFKGRHMTRRLLRRRGTQFAT